MQHGKFIQQCLLVCFCRTNSCKNCWVNVSPHIANAKPEAAGAAWFLPLSSAQHLSRGIQDTQAEKRATPLIGWESLKASWLEWFSDLSKTWEFPEKNKVLSSLLHLLVSGVVASCNSRVVISSIAKMMAGIYVPYLISTAFPFKTWWKSS